MRLDGRIGLFVVLAAVFVTCLVVGDLVGVKVIGGTVPGLGWSWATTVGMTAFPITFLLTDLLNERSRGGWTPSMMTQDGARLTVVFSREAEAER